MYIELIADVMATILSVVFFIGLLKTYLLHEVRQLLLLVIGAIFFVIAYFLDFIGRICENVQLAQYFFRIYFVLSIIATLLLLICVLLMKYPELPSRYHVYSLIFGGYIFFRAFIARIDITYCGSIITRSPPKSVLIDYTFLFIVAIVLITEWFHLAFLFLRRYKKSPMKFEIYGLIVGLMIIFIGVPIAAVLFLAGFFTESIMIGVSTILISISFALFGALFIMFPELSYVISANIRGILILTREGIPIFSILRDQEARIVTLISGFISAISSFGETIFGNAGKLKVISFENLNLILTFGKRIVICFLVDQPIRIHYQILNSLQNKLERITIPPVITEDVTSKIAQIVMSSICMLLDPEASCSTS